MCVIYIITLDILKEAGLEIEDKAQKRLYNEEFRRTQPSCYF